MLSALRGAGVPLQRIRPAVAKLSSEICLDHALASRQVYTDGAELIFDYAVHSDDEALFTVVRTGQQHFADVIRGYLERITYGDDGWAERLRLPAYATAEVTVDPRQASSPSSSTAARASRISSTASRPATASPRSPATSPSPPRRWRT